MYCRHVLRVLMKFSVEFIENIKSIIGLLYWRIKVGAIGPPEFPISRDGKSYIGRTFSTSDGLLYGVGVIDEPNELKLLHSGFSSPMDSAIHQAVEVLPLMEDNRSAFSTTETADCKLPIMGVRSTQGLKVHLGHLDLDLSDLPLKRFIYLNAGHGKPLDLSGVRARNRLLLGKPIHSATYSSSQQNTRTTFRASDLVVVFIDGLSSDFFRDNPMQNLMPRTFRFFQDGVCFSNFRSAGEWTLPSVASIFTGMETLRHGVWHPRYSGELPTEQLTLSEIFQRAGFLTSMQGGDWRISPLYGFVRGFDRTLYRRDGSIDWFVSKFMDFHHAFQNRNHFAWISAMELHPPWMSLVPPLAVQASTPNSYLVDPNHRSRMKSVHLPNNAAMREAYTSMLRHLDRRLNTLYDYLDSLQTERDLTIALVSDHGQSYLTDDASVLSDARTRVPLLIRSPNLKAMTLETPVQSSDVLPLLVSAVNDVGDSNLSHGELIGTFPGAVPRRYALSETIYPGQRYGCKVSDGQGWFEFASNELVTDSGAKISSLHLVGRSSSLTHLVGGYSEEQIQLILTDRLRKIGAFSNLSV